MTTESPSALTAALWSGATGIIFGFMMEKGKVYIPAIIAGQFELTNFTMMKMFLGAVSSSLIANSLLWLGPTRATFESARRGRVYSDHTISSTALGAIMLGAGMAVAGSCPGSLAVQIGAGGGVVSLVSLLGAFSGAACFAFLERYLRRFYKKTPEDTAVDRKLGLPYHAVAIPLVGVLAVVIRFLEVYFPWNKEIASSLDTSSIFSFISSSVRLTAWHPLVAGIVIGSLQIPLALLIKYASGLALCVSVLNPYICIYRKALGTSSSYMTVFSAACSVCPRSISENEFLKSQRSSGSWWQPAFLVGASLGSFLSCRLSGAVFSTSGYSLIKAFVGGFLMLFGSRLAGGCTSGHGISGFSQLALNSIIAVPAMFGGGIATALLLKNLGL